MMRQWRPITEFTTKKRKQVLKTSIVKGEHIEPVTTDDGAPVIMYVDSGEVQQLYARCICRQTHKGTANKQRVDYVSNETLRSLVRNPARTFVRNVTSPTFPVPYAVYTDGAFKWVKTNRQKIFLLAADEHKTLRTSAGAVIYKNQCAQEVLMVNIQDDLIAAINPYVVEAIGVIAALHTYIKLMRHATVWLDCQALVKKINSYKAQQAKGASEHMASCPYIATIFKLGFGLEIKYEWVRSHIERTNKNRSTWTDNKLVTMQQIMQRMQTFTRYQKDFEIGLEL